MSFRSNELQVIGAIVCVALLGVNAHAQKKRRARPPAPPAFVNSASHVAAELAKGTLKPSETQPGYEVALRLKDDVKSNGDVVLKKGTTITGVVRNVKSVESKGPAQLMMEIEWFAPPLQGKAARQLSIALQSVTQMNQVAEQKQPEKIERIALTDANTTRNVAARTSVTSNAAMLNMPSVIAVDTKTASSLESNFGASSSEKLFKVGRSEWITAGGTKQSVELFSHLSNDTMITSPSKDFVISSGAQMQLLVGVSKQ
jgi:urease accessory protein UreE